VKNVALEFRHNSIAPYQKRLRAGVWIGADTKKFV
jgi:hypothetical protein